MPTDTATNVRPRTTWRVMLGMFAVTMGTLLAVIHFGVHRALLPGAAPWVFAAGLVLTLPALLARRRAPGRTRGAGTGERSHSAVTQLITACSLAELPALAGAAHYLLGRDPRGTALLLIASALLLWRLRPRP